MTPTNTAMTPEIKNIADNNGDKHTVVPTPHTHSQGDVDGLVDALAAKAEARHHHNSIYETKGHQTAVVSTVKDPSESDTTYIQLGFEDLREEEFYQYARISLANLNNLKRALLNPDTTPTADSDKLVTSGGVKAALDEKMGIMSFDSVPTTGSNNLVKSGNIRESLQYEGQIIPMTFNESLGSQAIENIVPWYRDGCVELHYLLMKTAGSAIPVKNLFHSNTCTTYYADDIGNLTTTRWVAITIRKTVTGASTPVCVITLDGVITPS